MATSVLICDDSRLARRQLARSLPDDWDIKIEYAEHGPLLRTNQRLNQRYYSST